MARYIDADRLLDAIKQWETNYKKFNNFPQVPDPAIEEAIDKAHIIASMVVDQPAADVVPVVRCKECRWFLPAVHGLPSVCVRGTHMVEEAPDDYCSHAEPKVRG